MSSTVPIPPQEESDLLELMCLYSLPDNLTKAKEYWVQAAELREREGIQKPRLGYSPRYATHLSWKTGKRALNCRGMLMPISNQGNYFLFSNCRRRPPSVPREHH